MSGITAEAATLVAPGRLEVSEVLLRPPAEGELVVRNVAAAICGSDVHRVFGETPFFADGADYDYPCPPGYPGHEGIGEVVLSRSPSFTAGQLVLTAPDNSCNRTFASHQVVPDRFVLPAPSGPVPMHVLLAQHLGTVLYALSRFWTGSGRGCTALVNGTGSAGLFFVQMLKRREFDRVIAADPLDDRLEVARSFGADETVTAGAPETALAVLELTGGRGADLVIEASGTDSGRQTAMAAAAAKGRVGFYGLPEKRELAIPYAQLFRREVALISAVGAQQEPGLPSFREALRLVDTGAVVVNSHITHTFGIEKIAHAFQLAHDRPPGLVKVGITFD